MIKVKLPEVFIGFDGGEYKSPDQTIGTPTKALLWILNHSKEERLTPPKALTLGTQVAKDGEYEVDNTDYDIVKSAIEKAAFLDNVIKANLLNNLQSAKVRHDDDVAKAAAKEKK